MKVLITGVAGFIGSHLTERLLAEGNEVLGLDCFTDFYDRVTKEANLAAASAHSNFSLLEADLLTVDIELLLGGVDAVFHLAAQPGVRGSWGRRFEVYIRNNIAATQRLLEGLRERPVPCVYASSSSVYGAVARLPVYEDDRPTPLSPYGVTKLAAENLACLYAAEYAVPVTSVRYFTVYGPRQRPDMAFTRFLRAALTGAPLTVLGDGEQSRDFTFVDDAVDATVRALEGAPGRFYNVGGGSRVTLNEAISIIQQLTGRRIAIDRGATVKGDVPHTGADTTRAREELGWVPRVSLREGLEAHLDWAREVLEVLPPSARTAV